MYGPLRRRLFTRLIALSTPPLPIADVVVSWGLCHPEQTLDIAASLRYFQCLLEIQKLRGLSEEGRERPHGGIRHRIHYHPCAHPETAQRLSERSPQGG